MPHIPKKHHSSKRKKIFICCVIGCMIALIAAAVITVLLFQNTKTSTTSDPSITDVTVDFQEDPSIEIGTQAMLYDFIEQVQNGQLITENRKIDTSKVGNQEQTVTVKNQNGEEKTFSFQLHIIDTTPPVITKYQQTVTVNEGDVPNFSEYVTATDNSQQSVAVSISGTYDSKKAGTYPLQYIVMDESGNTSTQAFELIVKKSSQKNESSSAEPPTEKNPYYIKVNRLQNVVEVYGLDQNNQYTSLKKVFLCSTGEATPIGTFKTSDKYTWRLLFGNVYGQYATRITGHILFHSVPYTQQQKDTLEYWEYNKLGTDASMGCIRLTAQDAKWIYDHCKSGTTVEIYDSEDLGNITKPTIQIIDETDPYKGWDPTDPDPKNPWKN